MSDYQEPSITYGVSIVAAAIVVDYLRQLEDLDALSQFAPPRHDTPTQTTRQHTQ